MEGNIARDARTKDALRLVGPLWEFKKIMEILRRLDGLGNALSCERWVSSSLWRTIETNVLNDINCDPMVTVKTTRLRTWTMRR